jgi:hypothetical protein
MFGNVLHPQLEGRDRVALGNGPQAIGKGAANVPRGNEIEPAGLSPPGRSKLCRLEILVQG